MVSAGLSSRGPGGGRTSDELRLGPRRRGLLGGVWVAVVLLAIGLNVAGLPARRAEMTSPCVDAGACAVAQLAPEEIGLLQRVGVSSEAYFWYLEGLSAFMLLACLITGALIYGKRRDSLVAFLASLFLVVVAASTPKNIEALATAAPQWLPLQRGFGALASSLVVALFFLLPNGRPSPRWTGWLVRGWAFVRLATALTLGTQPGLDQAVLGVEVLLILGGLGAQVHRYLRVSTPIERQQTKWIVVVFVLQVMVYAAITVGLLLTPGRSQPGLQRMLVDFGSYHLYVLSFLAVPASFAFAILRHRLWDIDVIINRSLVYGGLTVLLLLTLGTSVLVLQRVALLLTDSQQMPVVMGLSMLGVGALFGPARRGLRRVVDRRLYGIGIDYSRIAKGMRRQASPGASTPAAITARGSTDLELLARELPARPHCGVLARTPAPEGEKLGLLTTLSAQAEALMRRSRPGSSAEWVAYTDLQLIGKGGMADVYRAHHPILDQLVAIKILSPQRARAGSLRIERFEREGRIVSRLDHPNIVQVHDHGSMAGDSFYIVMEYVDGLDLQQYLQQQGHMRLAHAVPILGQVAAALDHAHGEGIVHRDIKPSNVMLQPIRPGPPRPPFRAVLTDFGIAKAAATTRLTSDNLMGTLYYIAPEQIRDAAVVDARADIYAFGVLAFELITGRLPFEQSTPVALMLAHLQRPPPDPRRLVPDLPETVACAILEALAKDPAQRPPTATALVAKLRARKEVH